MYNTSLKEFLEKEGKAKEILWFPIVTNCKEDYCNVLGHRLDAYHEALNRYLQDKTLVNLVKKLNTGIKNCLKFYCEGYPHEAYNILKKAFEEVDLKNRLGLDDINNRSECIKVLEKGTYYRIRANKKTSDPVDLYHISFKKPYLCKDYRFNGKGYPCLYLSYNRDGCETEMSFSKEKDTLASFKYDENVDENEIKLFDLTWINDFGNDKKGSEDKENRLFSILWPIIASCYGISMYCRDIDKECPSITKLFKIEYVIPQMFAEYVHFHLKLDGIIYYTVRNENLDPSQSNMKNVVLFPKYKESEDYDTELLNKFKIKILK